jgi:hypothetical protein
MKLSRVGVACALRALVSTALATSVILVPTGTASAADSETPVLSSFAVSANEVTPGQQITFSYVASDSAGALSRLRLAYLDTTAHIDVLTFDGPLTLAGSLTITVPDTWLNGPHMLSWVQLTDPTNPTNLSGNRIWFYRSGIAVVSSGSSGPTSHTLPFTPSDLTVSGSTYERTAPTLTSVSASGPARPGETMSIHYLATEASGSLSSVLLSFRDAYQIERTISASSSGPFPLDGVVEQAIPATWPNGTYLLNHVTLTDLHGNGGTYYAAGVVRVSPWDAQGPSTHTVDFGAATFTVSDSTADFTPPALASVRLDGSPLLPGMAASLSYRIESQDPVTSVSFRYAAPLGPSLTFTTGSTVLAGSLPAPIPGNGPLGAYTLQTIDLKDSAGNTITYYRNGSTSQGRGQIFGTHTLALSTMDLFAGRVPSAPVMEGVNTGSGTAVVFWGAPAVDADPLLVTKYTITAQPGGRTVTTSGSVDEAQITGLTNGTSYRFSVKASNVLGASPASSPSAAVTPRMSTNIIGVGDFSGDGRNDLIGAKFAPFRMLERRPTYLYRGNGRGGLAWSTGLDHPYGPQDLILFSPGDFTGDGFSDVLIVGDSGWLTVDPGDGRGGFKPRPGGREYISSGWGRMRTVFGPGDFSGDRKNDVMAVTGTGDLYLYRGNGRGAFASAGQKIGKGWGNFLTVFSGGDFSGDGKNDVMAVSKDGGLNLYRGNGRGGFAAAGQRIGNGWGGFLSVLSAGDFSGDRKTDVLAVSMTGDLYLYRGNGRSGFAGARQKIGAGWTAFR